MSFCFHFFLHGESQVCASIEVKQHPPVWNLTNHHLNLLQDDQVHFQGQHQVFTTHLCCRG